MTEAEMVLKEELDDLRAKYASLQDDYDAIKHYAEIGKAYIEFQKEICAPMRNIG